MNTVSFDTSRDALKAIKQIAGDALVAARWHDVRVPSAMLLSRPELAYRLKRIQHAELVHYLRCDASHYVLLMIREAVAEALVMLDQGDRELAANLTLVEPFRHNLYANALIAALLASERQSLRKEAEHWRTVKGVKIETNIAAVFVGQG